MADPEQIHQEVLAEEQGKGVTPAVAEARAKAARARAEHGSPHPKEPKWWPGAQPHLEGGDEGGAEEVAEAEEPAAEEEATADVQAAEVEPDAPEAAPEPATEEPVAPAAAGTTEPAPAPQAVPQQPAAAAAPAAPAAAQPAAAATATQVVVPKTTGVSHGTVSGNRLRPEDEVSTEAQFEGQKAMYERRKLIDELVATGVPTVAADDTDRPRGPWLAVLYLLIPLLVVFYLATNDSDTEAEATSGEVASETPAEGGGGEGGVTTEIVAADIEWDADAITLTADEPNELEVVNDDATVHNLSIYETPEDAESQSNPLYKGEDVAAGASAPYEIDPLKKGEYTFICDYHINMQGTATVE